MAHHSSQWTRDAADYHTIAIHYGVIATVLILIGIGWYVAGVSGLVKVTDQGIIIVRGGGGPGFLFGPLTASIGVTAAVAGRYYWERAEQALEEPRGAA